MFKIYDNIALGQLREKGLQHRKKPLFAHFIAYYSENILDSVISWPHIEVTSFYY